MICLISSEFDSKFKDLFVIVVRFKRFGDVFLIFFCPYIGHLYEYEYEYSKVKCKGVTDDRISKR